LLEGSGGHDARQVILVRMTGASGGDRFCRIAGELIVSRIGLGGVWLAGPDALGPPPDRDAATAVLRRALELGVTLIDTADAYGPGVSERLIAEALHPYPEDLVIATKGGLRRDARGGWLSAGSPDQLRRACEASLQRLRLDRIDLYQLHDVDPAVPIEDSVGALSDLCREGLIRHIGLCNVSLEQLERARRIATIASVQNPLNPVQRHWEPLLAACQEYGIVFVASVPLARGRLAAVDGPLAAVAKTHGLTPAQAALAWTLLRSPVTVPIPGTASVVQLEENVAALAVAVGSADGSAPR
jgi:pyridoxine 4-dehydrogenase